MRKNRKSTLKLVYSAMCLALCIVLPFLTGQIPEIGGMLCPMHFPVFICGFLCGWQWGLGVGLVAPLLRSALFTMPPMMTAIPMAFELAVYGAMTGLVYKRLPLSRGNVYLCLGIAMVAGRAIWGAVRFVMAGIGAGEFPFSVFLAGAITNAIPGIILQMLIIPPVIIALDKIGKKQAMA